jgi:hypothetical protein
MCEGVEQIHLAQNRVQRRAFVNMVMRNTISWDITPCVNRRWFLAQLNLSILKMEAICSSETSVDTQRTTRRYIPGDGTLHNPRCENVKSYCNETSGSIKYGKFIQKMIYCQLLVNVTFKLPAGRLVANVLTRYRGK